MNSRLILVLAAVLVFNGGFASQQNPDFIIIVNTNNPDTAIQRARLDGMFLGKIESWPDGIEIEPVENIDADLREEFAQIIHARSSAAVLAYWAAKTFSQYISPPQKLSDSRVVEAHMSIV